MLAKATIDFKYGNDSIRKDQYFELKGLRVDANLVQKGFVEPVPRFEIEED